MKGSLNFALNVLEIPKKNALITYYKIYSSVPLGYNEAHGSVTTHYINKGEHEPRQNLFSKSPL